MNQLSERVTESCFIALDGLLTFTNNTADVGGGAIYWDRVQPRYLVPPYSCGSGPLANHALYGSDYATGLFVGAVRRRALYCVDSYNGD